MKIFLVIILGFSFSIKAQKLIRWNVNSIGLSVKSDEIYLSQSIGQSSITGSNHNSENKLRHGFQQPFQLNSFNTNGFLPPSNSIAVPPNPSYRKPMRHGYPSPL